MRLNESPNTKLILMREGGEVQSPQTSEAKA